eukprot:s1485_g8.t1
MCILPFDGLNWVHNLLFGAHMEMVKHGRPLDRASFRSYLPTVGIALKRVRNMHQDANAGAYYKAGHFHRVQQRSRAPALACALLLLAWSKSQHLPGSDSWLEAAPTRARPSRVKRCAQELDSGEFDFGEYDAPMGVSVMEAEEEEKAELAPPEAEVFMTRETGRYECQNCGYEYNPLFGEGNYGPGTQPKDDFQPVIEEVAGFAENQDYGVGFNTWTSGQKGIVIWGALGIAAFVAGEFAAFAEDYAQASGLLNEALDLFNIEKDEKVDGLIKHCKELKVWNEMLSLLRISTNHICNILQSFVMPPLRSLQPVQRSEGRLTLHLAKKEDLGVECQALETFLSKRR